MTNQKLNIMSWNTGITELRNDETTFQNILRHIKTFLKQDNSIAFLQQIPYKDPNHNWGIHRWYTDICKQFSEYDVMSHHGFNRGNVIMMTMVIASKGLITPASADFYPARTKTNREYAVCYNSFSLLGLHAKNETANQAYLHSIPETPDIIVGDFNAGDYCECGNRTAFQNILKNHICVCNMPTRVDPYSGRRTCIDHIFIKEHLVTRCSDMIVHSDVPFSDHFPLSVTIDLKG